MFAPLPLLIALCGLYRAARRAADGATRRRSARASAAIADVLWCAATLAIKPLILAHVALLEPTAVAYWLIVAVAVAGAAALRC